LEAEQEEITKAIAIGIFYFLVIDKKLNFKEKQEILGKVYKKVSKIGEYFEIVMISQEKFYIIIR